MPLDPDPDGRSSATAATTANPARALTHLCKGVGEVVIVDPAGQAVHGSLAMIPVGCNGEGR